MLCLCSTLVIGQKGRQKTNLQKNNDSHNIVMVLWYIEKYTDPI